MPTAVTPWPKDEPLRASVNNFGYGGTNCHIIIERAPAKVSLNGSGANANGAVDHGCASRVHVLSSKDPAVTQASAKRFATYIRQSIASRTQVPLADLAYTLAERGSRFPWAVAVKARSLGELADRLDESKLKATRERRTTPRVGFVFNGQGAQWHAMGRELIAAYPIFSSAIWRADVILAEYGATWSLHGESSLLTYQ